MTEKRKRREKDKQAKEMKDTSVTYTDKCGLKTQGHLHVNIKVHVKLYVNVHMYLLLSNVHSYMTWLLAIWTNTGISGLFSSDCW